MITVLGSATAKLLIAWHFQRWCRGVTALQLKPLESPLVQSLTETALIDFRACEDYTSGSKISNLAKPAFNWSEKVAAVSVALAEYLIKLSSIIAWRT